MTVTSTVFSRIKQYVTFNDKASFFGDASLRSFLLPLQIKSDGKSNIKCNDLTDVSPKTRTRDIFYKTIKFTVTVFKSDRKCNGSLKKIMAAYSILD